MAAEWAEKGQLDSYLFHMAESLHRSWSALPYRCSNPGSYSRQPKSQNQCHICSITSAWVKTKYLSSYLNTRQTIRLVFQYSEVQEWEFRFFFFYTVLD